jgi:hypothetical protein
MNFVKLSNITFFHRAQWIAQRVFIALAVVLLSTLLAYAQSTQAPDGEPGQITGTVTDVRGDAVPGATVVLMRSSGDDLETATTDENGLFAFKNVMPAVPCHVTVRAEGFAEWSSPEIALTPGQVDSLGGIPLQLATQNTTITVTYKPVEVATEQIKIEETQRVFGIVPNFYVTYDGETTQPLTPKMKFKLALRVSYDPITISGVSFLAGIKQAADTPSYRQGVKGYGERFGAASADGFSDIIVGGAVLPSLLHQDPRYFYQGTGTTSSRIRHAALSPFITRWDNGKWGPNYSSVGGDLASSAISNLYYPKSDRGAGLVFGNFAISTAERVGSSLAQEFLLGKLTHRARRIE